MLTLKDAETGHNYEVIKIHGSGAMEAPHHGYGPEPKERPCISAVSRLRGIRLK